MLRHSRSSSIQYQRRFSSSWIKQVRDFPKGVLKLYYDILTYKYIEDVSRQSSVTTSWSQRADKKNTHRDKNNEILLNILQHYTNSDYAQRNGRVPRNQYAFQRKLKYDISSCLPLVLVSFIPVIGNIFVLGGVILSPRLLLSKHFYSVDALRKYSHIEYHQRLSNYQDAIPNKNGNNEEDRKNDGNIVQDFDITGPYMFHDMKQFFDEVSLSITSDQRETTTFDTLSRDKLINLCNTVGVLKINNTLNKLILSFSPTILLRKTLSHFAKELIVDDVLFLYEAIIATKNDQVKYSSFIEATCYSLSDTELIEAINLRGLPIDEKLSIQDLRECLINHLTMVRHIYLQNHESLSQDLFYKKLELFVLRVPLVRHQKKSLL